MKLGALFLMLLAVLFQLSVALARDPSEVYVGENFRFRIGDVRPTQFAVGMGEVEVRTAKLERHLDDDAWMEEYLKDHRASVVLGPGGRIYLVDGHHIVYSLHNLSIKKMYGVMVGDYSKFSEEKFWKSMIKKNWVYLNDENGKPRLISELPSRIEDLKDDPYRSLAYFVKKEGGFEEGSAPFQEFRWAEFFREKLGPIKAKTRQDFEKIIPKALELAHTAEASHLPGFIPGPGLIPATDCSSVFLPVRSSQ